MDDLAKNRVHIDEIDAKILSLLRERAEKCKRIKEIKAKNGIPTQDKLREEEILQKCKTSYESSIYQKILEESRNLQT